MALSHLTGEYLAKFCEESLVPASQRRANAIEKFEACEVGNFWTNMKMLTRDPGYNILPRVTFSSFLRVARRLTRDILGPLTDNVVVGAFTGGASTSRPRTMSHPALKYVGKADLTERVEKFIPIMYREMPLLEEYNTFREINFVTGSVLFTVPKKTDIDRCACKEPDVNMFLQKGVGAHIRRRLRRHGINLNDQSVNRDLARRGSVSDDLATLDLSSASDTIAIETVKSMLPSEWFEYLNDIRSPYVSMDGRNHRMQMFSSMGNGFTFELESLLFYVLMRTTAYFAGTAGIISVYGDDIIIPSGMYDDATWVLAEFGFSVNADKSFHAGPFRESCGGHYHNGIDITPFYLKRPPERLTDVIRVANQLRRWAFADWPRAYEYRIYAVWHEIALLVPRDLWGGSDYSVDTQLVAPGPAKNKLVRVSEKLKLDAKGAYLHWQNSNWSRTQLHEAAVEPISTNQICRRRRVNSGTSVCSDWFYEELVG